MSFIYVKIFVNLPTISKTCVFRQIVPTSPASIPFICPIIPLELNSGLLFEACPWSDIHVPEVVILRIFILYTKSFFFHDKVMKSSPCTTTSASKTSRESEDISSTSFQYCHGVNKFCRNLIECHTLLYFRIKRFDFSLCIIVNLDKIPFFKSEKKHKPRATPTLQNTPDGWIWEVNNAI